MCETWLRYSTMKIYVISEGSIHEGGSVVDVFLNKTEAFAEYHARCQQKREHCRDMFEHSEEFGLLCPEDWLKETKEIEILEETTIFVEADFISIRTYDREP